MTATTNTANPTIADEYRVPDTVLDATPVMDVPTLRAYLEDWIKTEPELRYLGHIKLLRIAELMHADKTLAEISQDTGIPQEMITPNGETQRVLRDEITRFGTWLGQRDATLKKVPASDFTVPEDLSGCLNAKRNIVVSYTEKKLTSETLADFLNQRYARGDVTMTRAAFAGAATVIAYDPTGVGWFMAHVEADRAGEGAQPAVLMLKILDLGATVRDDLVTASENIREALGPADPEKLNHALRLTAWVDPGRVREIFALQERVRTQNRAAATAMLREIGTFVKQLETLAGDDELALIKNLARAGAHEASLVTALLDQYMPEERNERRHLEVEARSWLRERGMSRQANMLLSHVMWSLAHNETDLLETCLLERSAGSRNWEEPLLEAQVAQEST